MDTLPPISYNDRPIFKSWIEAGEKTKPMKIIIHDGWKIRECKNGYKLMCKVVPPKCGNTCQCHH